MSAERDVNRIVRSWIRTEEHESADRVLQTVLSRLDTTPQRRSWWTAWRKFQMNKLVLTATAAATVLAVAVVGYNLLPGRGIGGKGATPTSSLLARGNFVVRDWGPVELEATRDGSRVAGHMTVGLELGDPANPSRGSFTVDLQCAQTDERGLIRIGGTVTGGAGELGGFMHAGTWAAIVLKRGSEVRAYVWTGQALSANPPASCLAYLAQEVTWVDPSRDDIALRLIDGTVEFGP